MTPDLRVNRPTISAEFLESNTRRRIVAGAAQAIAADGYQVVTVSDIVAAAGCARNTFYECYGDKESAALELVANLGLQIEEISESHSVDVLAIEVAAMHAAGHPDRAGNHLLQAAQLVRVLNDCGLTRHPLVTDPRQGRLPSGRHGLPGEFVIANQRTRLLSGMATAVADRGFLATRISDVTAAAAQSRRTFYEHYGNLQTLGRALVADATSRELPDGLDLRSGLAAVAIEIVASRIVSAEHPPVHLQAIATIDALAAALEATPDDDGRPAGGGLDG